jgi:GNAT superfamily N-acetyltransferase
MNVRELLSEDELRQAFPVMHELRTQLNVDEFVARVASMRRGGYRLFALFVDDRIVSLAGIAVQENLYSNRHVWLYDLVTAAECRSRGYGRQILSFVEDFARENGCESVALVSGVQRTSAHRFYEEHMGYEKPCFLFEKKV